jgi:hypothetical protein
LAGLSAADINEERRKQRAFSADRWTEAVPSWIIDKGRGQGRRERGGFWRPTAASETKRVQHMASRLPSRILACLAAGAILLAACRAQAGSQLAAQPSWQPVESQIVYQALVDYLDAVGVPPGQQVDVRELWLATGGDKSAGLVDRLAECLAATNPRVAELVSYCAHLDPQGGLPEFAWLADSATPPLVRNNMRLYLARALVEAGYYDEAISWTDGLEPRDVVAPDVLLFYRAVAHHQLVQPDRADAELAQLVQREDELPLRFQKLAVLMQQDLAGLHDQSLDHIARRMADVRRRLAQGNSGQRVQDVENGVIDSLDKLIKKAEEQLQRQQAQCSSSGSQQSSTPMQDSRLAELKAPGKVQQRDVGHGTGWGNLPDKQREQALQDIGREFPSHYREVVEQYFRRLATEGSDADHQSDHR